MSDTNIFLELSEGLNRASGNKVCSASCEHGGLCCEPTDHDGPHQARGFGDVVYCEWTDDE